MASNVVIGWIVVPGKKSRIREENSAREEGSSWARRNVGTSSIVLEKQAGRKGGFQESEEDEAGTGTGYWISYLRSLLLRAGEGARSKSQAMDSVGCSEAVIDVHYSDAWSAGVEHSQKGGQAIEVSTVTNGSWDGH
jgi:hypothetical protein